MQDDAYSEAFVGHAVLVLSVKMTTMKTMATVKNYENKCATNLQHHHKQQLEQRQLEQRVHQQADHKAEHQ